LFLTISAAMPAASRRTSKASELSSQIRGVWQRIYERPRNRQGTGPACAVNTRETSQVKQIQEGGPDDDGSRMQDDKLKYLEFLQAVISRMASNPFLIKGWSVGLTTAVLGFSVKESNWALALIAVVSAASFWLLDAYNLGLERLFRRLWVTAVADAQAKFDMSPSALGVKNWCEAAWRPAVWLVHLPVIVVSLLAALVLFLVHSTK
jgi:hypothetical protein